METLIDLVSLAQMEASFNRKVFYSLMIIGPIVIIILILLVKAFKDQGEKLLGARALPALTTMCLLAYFAIAQHLQHRKVEEHMTDVIFELQNLKTAQDQQTDRISISMDSFRADYADLALEQAKTYRLIQEAENKRIALLLPHLRKYLLEQNGGLDPYDGFDPRT